jgi:hypothetical protein
VGREAFRVFVARPLQGFHGIASVAQLDPVRDGLKAGHGDPRQGGPREVRVDLSRKVKRGKSCHGACAVPEATRRTLPLAGRLRATLPFAHPREALPPNPQTIASLASYGMTFAAICSNGHAARDVVADMDALISRYGPAAHVRDVMPRITCAACGARVGATIAQNPSLPPAHVRLSSGWN